ncbi:hypothetical protein AB0O14_19045 [Microbacterium foliorum]
MAKAAAIPEGYICTLFSDSWIHTVLRTVDLSNRRADFVQNLHKVSRTLASLLDRQSGIIRVTWTTLANTTSTSRATVARIIAILKEHYLLAVIASGRSAEKTPRGQERRNLAPVYTPIIPAPFTADELIDSNSFYDENGNLFVTETPSPIRDKKISYIEAQRNGTYTKFFKQHYALYAFTHRKALEAKLQSLKHSYKTKKARQKALIHLARTLQHHSYDLRVLSAKSILEVTTPFFEAGWSVYDVLYALEYRSDDSPWNTHGSAGMRSMKSWLRLRLNAWMSGEEILESRSARENREYTASRSQNKTSQSRQRPTSRMPIRLKRQVKVSMYGERKARYLFPELF